MDKLKKITQSFKNLDRNSNTNDEVTLEVLDHQVAIHRKVQDGNNSASYNILIDDNGVYDCSYLEGKHPKELSLSIDVVTELFDQMSRDTSSHDLKTQLAS